MKTDIEYLGHLFYKNGQSSGIFAGDMCYCRNCKILACLFVNDLYMKSARVYIMNGNKSSLLKDWPELTLTCDEMIIKNIIE